MEEKLTIEGLTIAPGVIETIVSLAISQIEGVALVGSRISDGVISILNKKHVPQGVLIYMDEEKIAVEAHVQVYYGFPLQEVAKQIRNAVADALLAQVGTEVGCVNVYIDGIQFAE